MPAADRVARQIAANGREVTLRLATTTGGPTLDYAVIAHVAGYAPTDLAPGAGTVQGDRLVRISQAELDRRGVSRAMKPGDRIIIDGVVTAVQAAPAIGYHGRVPVVHVLRVRGG